MKIAVAKPFNFAHGPVTKHYAEGEHEVTAEVAAHAAGAHCRAAAARGGKP